MGVPFILSQFVRGTEYYSVLAIVKIIVVGTLIISALPAAIVCRVISLWGLREAAVRIVSVVLLVAIVGEASIIFLDCPVLVVDTLCCVRLALELVYSALQAMILIFCAFSEVFPVIRVFLGLFQFALLLPDVIVLFILAATIKVCLPIHECQNCEHDHHDEEDSSVDVLNELVLIVREASTCNEVAEYRLAPVIVQEAEVTSDGFETELL